jgi:hypothetical protein
LRGDVIGYDLCNGFAQGAKNGPANRAAISRHADECYVYVTSYDGDQFNINLLSEDRQAIVTVQDAMQKWGKFILVYEPHQADIVIMVTSRPTEDILAVYDAHGWPRNQYLWRMTGRGGLQPSESPLVTNLEKAFDLVAAKR